jgi:predicted DNA-binding transcriptional regulator YafY
VEVGVSNLHRIQWIDTMIRAGRHPNCSTIAAHFEISRRQATRDIEYLRDSMGAPLAYDPGENGYFYTDETFVLPAQLVSSEEQRALAYLSHQYRQSGGALGEQLALLFARLAGEEVGQPQAWERPRLPMCDAHPRTVRWYEPLRRAIAERRQVEIEYLDPQNRRTTRRFCPYRLYNRWVSTYVVGWCLLRDELRSLRLSRIRALRVLDATFDVAPTFDPRDYDEGASMVWGDPYAAVVRFDRPPNPRDLPASAAPVDERTYRLTFFRSGEILTTLLGQPVPFRILSPNWLRERLRTRIRRLIDEEAV